MTTTPTTTTTMASPPRRPSPPHCITWPLRPLLYTRKDVACTCAATTTQWAHMAHFRWVQRRRLGDLAEAHVRKCAQQDAADHWHAVGVAAQGLRLPVGEGRQVHRPGEPLAPQLFATEHVPHNIPRDEVLVMFGEAWCHFSVLLGFATRVPYAVGQVPHHPQGVDGEVQEPPAREDVEQQGVQLTSAQKGGPWPWKRHQRLHGLRACRWYSAFDSCTQA